MYNIRAGFSVKWSFPSHVDIFMSVYYIIHVYSIAKRCVVLLIIIAHLEPYCGVSTLKNYGHGLWLFALVPWSHLYLKKIDT